MKKSEAFALAVKCVRLAEEKLGKDSEFITATACRLAYWGQDGKGALLICQVFHALRTGKFAQVLDTNPVSPEALKLASEHPKDVLDAVDKFVSLGAMDLAKKWIGNLAIIEERKSDGRSRRLEALLLG